LLKWLVILTLASALAMAFATHLAGAAEPAKLPADVDAWSIPMNGAVAARTVAPTGDPAMQVWQLLDDQQSGRYDLVIEPWRTVPLAPSAEVWRHIAIAEAQIAMGDLTAAGESLENAGALQPENPLVDYYLGLWRLEQAERALDWYEPGVQLAAMFVSYPPDIQAEVAPWRIAPNSKAMYQLAAMAHLERAIGAADQVELDQPLTSVDWPTSAALRPTVGDLLQALGADHFDAKAHNMLGYLHLENGAAEEAEYHMDAAADCGVVTVFGYEDLARLYEEQDRPLDAFRANAKSAAHGGGLVGPTRGMIRNLREAFRDL
jgi:tetratricopeptide (TPR) repeat protein